MRGARRAGLLLLAGAFLIAVLVEEPIADFSPLETALAVSFCALTLILAAGIIENFSRHWTYGVQATAVSAGILLAVLVAYSARHEFEAVIDRAIGDVSLGRTVVTDKGEVVAARKLDGSFVLTAKVNGRDGRFIFDTGASTVVIRAENAAALGFKPEDLDYSVPVSTANGTALAAPVIIPILSVGPITERNVEALITPSGSLHTNLLGMTFLERLGSYEVRGNRLILRRK
ncbi:retropepsin-like aspartic protease family protein [Microvirga terricola]|uniref:TIGR02281 family clan AA aspartic protease n=1 Tax=Microvirga terricola TaxID=2719797 RepID=A0ABX0VAQ9_9HYPH|nr:TIGR02281 family clan AA aspartic protease [Microvirga terricola]NIX76937.1 TIGR02281 family clan AA aspartic protease [Microvirga terricola]